MKTEKRTLILLIILIILFKEICKIRIVKVLRNLETKDIHIANLWSWKYRLQIKKTKYINPKMMSLTVKKI